MNFYFTNEIRTYLYLYSTPMALKTCSEDTTRASNSKWKYEKLVFVVRVPQTTQNLVNSRSCFAENGKEMHAHIHCTAHQTFCLVTFSLPSSPVLLVLFAFGCRLSSGFPVSSLRLMICRLVRVVITTKLSRTNKIDSKCQFA